MIDTPASDKVIVVGVEWAKEAEERVLVQESVDEVSVFKDGGTICSSAPGDAEYSSFKMIGCSDFKIVTLQVKNPEEVPEASEREAR